MSIGIYAMGGGYGHIMRACALARCILDRRPEQLIHLYLPRRGYRWAKKLGLEAKFPTAGAESKDGIARWIKAQVTSDGLRLLVVDCFPLGFHRELAEALELVPKRVFVTRWLDPGSLDDKTLEALKSFDCLISTERLHPLFASFPFQSVEPVLAVGAEQILERETARRILEVDTSSKLVLMVATRHDHLTMSLTERLRRVGIRHGFELRVLSPRSPWWEKAFPAARFLRAADLVVALAGSIYYEIVQAGVPAVLILLELANDNHPERAAGGLGASHPALRVASPSELDQLFPEVLHQAAQPLRPFQGSQQAATLVLEALDRPLKSKSQEFPSCTQPVSGDTLATRITASKTPTSSTLLTAR
jgi:hypothetical protein